MISSLRARTWGLLVYALIVMLVVGGLGWVTAAALQLELSDQLRLALWRLDSRVSPTLAREDSRPFQHYDPLYFPLPALQPQFTAYAPYTVLVPSPLLTVELPDWMLLHFQTTAKGNWLSPQVVAPEVVARLRRPQLHLDLKNVTPGRAELLADLSAHQPPADLLGRLPENGDTLVLPQYFQNPTEPLNQAANPPATQFLGQQGGLNDLNKRQEQQRAVQSENRGNGFINNTMSYNFDQVIPWAELGGKWSGLANGQPSVVTVGLLQPLWLKGPPERLVLARLAQSGGQKVAQGALLDWPRLCDILLGEIHDLFPEAQLHPVFDGDPVEFPERLMTTLPVQLDPGPHAGSVLGGWSPLRFGLFLAWLAAVLALLVVGLGGWTLLDLSERRFRFVSAVTHELRTPLTTLRLYLDMLNSGLVRDEPQKAEYLKTLDGEADRLHRLVSNVLDFARLEKQRPRLALREARPAEILEQARANWHERCKTVGKELVVEIAPGYRPVVSTDVDLVQQVLGNLIDNACKYSREAADGRIWLRARPDGQRWLVLEVEDRGPGVPAREMNGIFRAFRRGRSADVTAGGVGLGLALARRWTSLLGGKLLLRSGRDGVGACFQLRLRTGS